MEKPSWFKITDFILFAGTAVPAAIMTIYLMYADNVETQGSRAEWIGLCWAIVAVFILICARFIQVRKKELDRYIWYGKYGFMIEWLEYNPPKEDDEAEFNRLVEKTIKGWSEYYPKAENIVKNNVIWVCFKPGPITHVRGTTNKKVAGYTMAEGHKLVVGFREKDQALERTAFEHELGHLIQGHATGDWNENTHHERSKEYGLK